MTDQELHDARRAELLSGIQAVIFGTTAPQVLPGDDATIREVEGVPEHLRTHDQRTSLASAQQRAMTDLLRKPNAQVTADEAAAIRAAALLWMQKGDE